MGWNELPDLNCDKAYQLGGINKKTKKANPKQVEGYYLGFREVESKKSKTGLAKLHVFQTASGNHGVWGKTNLDSQLLNVKAGMMTRVSFVGMVPTKNNPMYKYKIQVDSDNVLDNLPEDFGSGESSDEAPGYTADELGEESSDETEGFSDNEPEEASADEEEAPADEEPPVPVQTKKQAAKPAATGANKARVEALLGKGKKAA